MDIFRYVTSTQPMKTNDIELKILKHICIYSECSQVEEVEAAASLICRQIRFKDPSRIVGRSISLED